MSSKIIKASGVAVATPEKLRLPQVLIGHHTEANSRRVEDFYLSIHEIFERWVTRSESQNTQRAYRADIVSFIRFLELRWPDESWKLLSATIQTVSDWRDMMLGLDRAPKTINRRLASVSSLFKFIAGCAAEGRLPINVPNPAHVQFIKRLSSEPVNETLSLSSTRARQLMGLPSGETVQDYQDRAIIKTMLYSAVRIQTLQQLDVDDFKTDGDRSTVKITEKGGKTRIIGIHFIAADAIGQHIQRAELTSGPLFRAQRNSRIKDELSATRMSLTSLWTRLNRYLSMLPEAINYRVAGKENGGSKEVSYCIYTPHSLRATTATLLLDAGVDIAKVQELLGHKHITTTQIYDKRRRSTDESASHDVPI